MVGSSRIRTRGVAHQRARDREALALADRELAAAAPERRRVALGQRAHELVGAGVLARAPQLGVARVGLSRGAGSPRPSRRTAPSPGRRTRSARAAMRGPRRDVDAVEGHAARARRRGSAAPDTRAWSCPRRRGPTSAVICADAQPRARRRAAPACRRDRRSARPRAHLARAARGERARARRVLLARAVHQDEDARRGRRRRPAAQPERAELDAGERRACRK